MLATKWPESFHGRMVWKDNITEFQFPIVIVKDFQYLNCLDISLCHLCVFVCSNSLFDPAMFYTPFLYLYLIFFYFYIFIICYINFKLHNTIYLYLLFDVFWFFDLLFNVFWLSGFIFTPNVWRNLCMNIHVCMSIRCLCIS